LALTSVCLQSWIDGRKYFDRQAETQLANEQRAMKSALIQKILQSGQEPADPDRQRTDPSRLWPRHDEYCGHGHDHDDEE
jgi:N-acetylglucosamine-6-phosphate deacetylase